MSKFFVNSQAFRRVLLEKDLSVNDAAQILHTKPFHVNRYLYGDVPIRGKTAHKLKHFFGFEVVTEKRT